METVVDVDVLVIGAGPSGSTAARELAVRGLDVLMLDRARFPRDKPCGGAVSIRGAGLLPFDLSPVVEETITGAHLRLRGGREITHDFSAPIAYMTQRSRLDQFLVEQALDAGANFRDGPCDGLVSNVSRLPDGSFKVQTKGEIYSSRGLIAADGANGVVARSLGFETHRETAVALEANLPCPNGIPARLRGRVSLQLGDMPGGYGWLFPKEDHINLGVGGWKSVIGKSLRPSLERLCHDYGIDPDALVAMRGHHLPMLPPKVSLTSGGAALIGDAAGLVDPLSGEGIAQAIASGIAVAPAMEDYLLESSTRSESIPTLSGYQLALERELLSEIASSTALMNIFHAWPDPFVKVLQHSRRFWRSMCHMLRGEQSLNGIVQSTGPFSHALQPMASLARRVNSRRYGLH